MNNPKSRFNRDKNTTPSKKRLFNNDGSNQSIEWVPLAKDIEDTTEFKRQTRSFDKPKRFGEGKREFNKDKNPRFDRSSNKPPRRFSESEQSEERPRLKFNQERLDHSNEFGSEGERKPKFKFIPSFKRESKSFDRKEQSFSGERRNFDNKFEKKPWQEKNNSERGFKKPWQEKNDSERGFKKPWQEKNDSERGFKKPWQEKNDSERGFKKPWQEKNDSERGFKKPWQEKNDSERGFKKPWQEKNDSERGFKKPFKKFDKPSMKDSSFRDKPFSRENGQSERFDRKRNFQANDRPQRRFNDKPQFKQEFSNADRPVRNSNFDGKRTRKEFSNKKRDEDFID